MSDRKLLCIVCVAVMIGAAPFLAAQSTTQSGSDQSQQQGQTQPMGSTMGSHMGQHMGSHMGSQEQVRQAQQALKDKGIDPGPVDGVMGPKTHAALRQFQQQNNLRVTGRLNTETSAALGLSGPNAASGSTPGIAGSTAGRRTNSMGATNESQSSMMGRPRSTPSAQGTTGTTTGATTSAGTTDTGKSRDQAELARRASVVLTEITSSPDKGIPQALLRRSKGIAVIPNVIKGAFGVGGRWGEGLLVGRNPDGTWGTPCYIQMTGASVGFQLGVSSTDVVLVLTGKDAIDALLRGKVKLGADAAVAAGPVGRAGEVGTDVRFEGPIYAYSRSKGLFAGVALDGAVISINDSSNHKVYGENVTGADILESHNVQANATVEPFLEAVRAKTTSRAE